MKSFLTRNGGRNGNSNNEDQVSILQPIEGEEQGQESAPKINKLSRTDAFDQPVVLQQSAVWSRGILWGIMGVTAFTIIWASVARIEQAVPATGKLEPVDRVQDVQAPVGGVVAQILVSEGDRVQRGDVLMRFDPRATEAQLQSLLEIRDSLVQETQFYNAQILGIPGPDPEQASQLNIRPEILQLTVNRSALVAENTLYRAQLGGGAGSLSASQLARLRVNSVEADSRAAAAQLEVAQLEQQEREVQIQLQAGRQSLEINQGILSDIRPLAEEGGIARIQLRRQEEEVLTGEAEVARLEQEQQRVQLAIAQAQQQLQNTIATTGTDLLNRIADNEKRIAEIDSQINRTISENRKRIAEIDSQLKQAQLTLQYQELRAPIDGMVFDLKAKGAGFVANTSEPILKLVPTDNLVAEVFITNQDIGFVREGMPVDVRIDSFPFSEFGDIEGTVVHIGSDALPPDQINPYYRFPTTVELEAQTLNVNGREVQLQSGMSVSTNIKTRDRSVISIFTDLFTGSLDSLRNVR